MAFIVYVVNQSTKYEPKPYFFEDPWEGEMALYMAHGLSVMAGLEDYEIYPNSRLAAYIAGDEYED